MHYNKLIIVVVITIIKVDKSSALSYLVASSTII